MSVFERQFLQGWLAKALWFWRITMKDSINNEKMFTNGFIGTLHREVVTICGVPVKFYYPEFDYDSGKASVRAVSTGFRKSKGKFLRKKVQQYIEWTGRTNTKCMKEGLEIPEVRLKWY